MCELFGLCSRIPTRVGFSLDLLARRGGIEGPHRDGWGVAFYQQREVILLREPRPAAESNLVRFIEDYSPPSRLVISHIRLATRGEIALHNTQPFIREMGGHTHSFAHNGDLQIGARRDNRRQHRFRPVGNTDSELVFCELLERLEILWRDCGVGPPPMTDRLQIVAGFAAELRTLGPANFIYADGDLMFAHAHRRTQPDGGIAPPGLHWLERCCDEPLAEAAAAGVSLETAPQEAVLVASVPLTGESWKPMDEGEIAVFQAGRLIHRQRPGASA